MFVRLYLEHCICLESSEPLNKSLNFMPEAGNTRQKWVWGEGSRIVRRGGRNRTRKRGRDGKKKKEERLWEGGNDGKVRLEHSVLSGLLLVHPQVKKK